MTKARMNPGQDGRSGWAAAEQARQPAPPGDVADGGPVQDILHSFQQAMWRRTARVCIISEGRGDDVNGIAVTAATSFSMNPSSVLVCVDKDASISSLLQEGVPFGLAVLGRQNEAVAAAFARKPSGRARFVHGAWQLQPDEPPWLLDAPANSLCMIERTMAYGSHVAVSGAVGAVRLGLDGPSLIYRDGNVWIGRLDLASPVRGTAASC